MLRRRVAALSWAGRPRCASPAAGGILAGGRLAQGPHTGCAASGPGSMREHARAHAALPLAHRPAADSVLQAMEQRLGGPTIPAVLTPPAITAASSPPGLPAGHAASAAPAAEGSYASDFHTPEEQRQGHSGSDVAQPAAPAPSTCVDLQPAAPPSLRVQEAARRPDTAPLQPAAAPQARPVAVVDGEGPWREFRLTLDARCFQVPPGTLACAALASQHCCLPCAGWAMHAHLCGQCLCGGHAAHGCAG